MDEVKPDKFDHEGYLKERNIDKRWKTCELCRQDDYDPQGSLRRAIISMV